MTTLAPSFMNGSFSFLQVTMTPIKASMSYIIRFKNTPITELAALEHLKYSCIMLLPLLRLHFSFEFFHPCRLSGHTLKIGLVRTHH